MLIFNFLILALSERPSYHKALGKTYKLYSYDFAHLDIYGYSVIPLTAH